MIGLAFGEGCPERRKGVPAGATGFFNVGDASLSSGLYDIGDEIILQNLVVPKTTQIFSLTIAEKRALY